MENPLWSETIKALRKELLEEIAATGFDETEKREHLYHITVGLDLLEERVRAIVENHIFDSREVS